MHATPFEHRRQSKPRRLRGRGAFVAADARIGPTRAPVYLGPPRGVVPRQSTDVLSIEDEDVATALRYVREHATDGIFVSDVISNATRSPSTLERRFKSALGRTIKAEISRVRLDRAKLLLQETELAIGKVATRAGFSEPKYFCDVFRKSEGLTAGDYRKQFRQ